MVALQGSLRGVVQPWIDAVQVAADERVEAATLPEGITVEMCVQAASEELFKRSGARWGGLRTDTIRPHRQGDDNAGDLSGISWGFGGWGWTGVGGWWNRLFPEGWGVGALNTNEFPLPGRVVQILEVKVDGKILTPVTDYQMYDNRRLVRMRDTATGALLSWPNCQRLAFPDTEQGTWSVTFQWGDLPPVAGVLAAHEWSVQKVLYASTQKNKIPQRAQSIHRQNVDINIVPSGGKDGATGIPLVDDFLDAYNPHSLFRRARVYSPDSIQGAIVSTAQPGPEVPTGASLFTEGTATVAQLVISDPNGLPLTVGDTKATFRVNSLLAGRHLSAVAASVSTASTSGPVVVQVRNLSQGPAVMLSTPLTIDANETDSSNAAVSAVIDPLHALLAEADELSIDVQQAGTDTLGLIVELTLA